MCGIVGAIAERNVVPILLEGLRRLEYRGYDSAGLAVLHYPSHFQRLRTQGKVQELADKLHTSPVMGHIGIAHTRWATHGGPSETNAHPHVSGPICLVHNGIIENYQELKTQLIARGTQFHSETDSEVIAHLLAEAVVTEANFAAVLVKTIQQLMGSYALLILKEDEQALYAVRSGSPLVIGLGLGENFVASDSLSLLPVTHRFIYLEEGDIAKITKTEVMIYDRFGQAVDRATEDQAAIQDAAHKGHFSHFMHKEIYEQPDVISNLIQECVNGDKIIFESFGNQAKALLTPIKQLKIVACGTSFHAGLIARYQIEALCGMPVDIEIASEFRYREQVVTEGTLLIGISQSGETADTLAALRLAKQLGYAATLAICNVGNSSLVREADLCFLMRAGMEIGVASTKAFTAQLLALLLLGAALAELNHNDHYHELLILLPSLPRRLQEVLALDESIAAMAEHFMLKKDALFLGRGMAYPLALEGALKLKEIAYIHAEGYAGGELKHGPLALVEEGLPVVAMLFDDRLFDKMKSNLLEVLARGAELFLLVGANKAAELGLKAQVIVLPAIASYLAPIVYAIPLQLLAYHVARLKGTDVDQPRNLAKSVTVE